MMWGSAALEVHGDRFVLPPAVIVDEGVSQNREQPALGIGPGTVLLPRPVGLEHRVLDQVLRLRRVASEPKRHAVQRIQVGQRFIIEGRAGAQVRPWAIYRRQRHGVIAPRRGLCHPRLFAARSSRLVPRRTRVQAPVPALIPLSLLEAIRNLDTPLEDGLEELAEEIVVRRLGLSPTVAAQIQRYRQSADAGSSGMDETVSVFRLVGRRSDAPLVFADAGRRAARYAARTRGRSPEHWSDVSPGPLARRWRSEARLGWRARVFDGELKSRPRTSLKSEWRAPLSIVALPAGEACAVLRLGLLEMLRWLTGFEGLSCTSGAVPAVIANASGARQSPRSTNDRRAELAEALLPPAWTAGCSSIFTDSTRWLPGARAEGDDYPAALRAAAPGRRAGRGGAQDRAAGTGAVSRPGDPLCPMEELHAALGSLVAGRTLAMEISPDDAVPYLDRVPYGVVELLSRLGATIVPSGPLVSRFAARWSAAGAGGSSVRRGGAGAVARQALGGRWDRAAAGLTEIGAAGAGRGGDGGAGPGLR